MKFYKKINHNAIAVVGTWDPVLPGHRSLFKKLLIHSKQKALNPYIIILYPNPAKFLHQNHYYDYFDLDARIALLRRLGINNIIVADLDQEDLRINPGVFFDKLSAAGELRLKELWAGENQDLGRGREGGPGFSIKKECVARNIDLKMLKNSFLVSLEKDGVYRNFKEARFDLAAGVLGYFPTHKLKPDGQIHMYDGAYSARLRLQPFDEADEMAITVEIKGEKIGEIQRPEGYDWLILKEKIADCEVGIRTK